jgi:hypothetical protein
MDNVNYLIYTISWNAVTELDIVMSLDVKIKSNQISPDVNTW